jgi:hypothetical protein
MFAVDKVNFVEHYIVHKVSMVQCERMAASASTAGILCGAA